MNFLILNDNGSLRWNLAIEKSGDIWTVAEKNTQTSLFKNPLTSGKTPAEAIGNFIEIEAELLESL